MARRNNNFGRKKRAVLNRNLKPKILNKPKRAGARSIDSGESQLPQDQLNSIYGARSARANGFGFFSPDRRGDKTLAIESGRMKQPFVDERYYSMYPASTRSFKGGCLFRCNINGEMKTIDVKPGTCVRCPDNSMCPDDRKCQGRDNWGDWGYGDTVLMDNGFACCTCAESGWLDYGGNEPVGRAMSGHYIGYLGDPWCDDGIEWDASQASNQIGWIDFYLQSHYGCLKGGNEKCYPSGPDEVESDGDELDIPIMNQVNGPLCDSTYPDGSCNYSENSFIFNWAGVEGGLVDDQINRIGSEGGQVHYNSGAQPIHFSCPQWGFDCGGFAYGRSPENPYLGCLGSQQRPNSSTNWWEPLMEIIPDSCKLGDNGGDINPHDDYGPEWSWWKEVVFGNSECTNWLTPVVDIYQHCNFIKDVPATCYGKCNRKVYLDQIGYDPGGFARTNGPGADENGVVPTCYCDDQCWFCGCDPVRICGTDTRAECQALGGNEAQMLEWCEQQCPTDCTHDDFLGINIPAGTIGGPGPGGSCYQGQSGAGGDCCGDFIQQCTLDKIELPCECYDEGNEVNFLSESTGGTTVCTLNNTSGDDRCSYSAPLGQGDYACDGGDGNECEQDCLEFCQNEMSLDPDYNWWNTAIFPNLDNQYCTMWDFNHNGMGFDSYSQWNWYTVPSCNVTMQGSSCTGGVCTCECTSCFGGTEVLNEYNDVPEIGCGGYGSHMQMGALKDDPSTGSSNVTTGAELNFSPACNHDPAGNFNCSKEFILNEATTNPQAPGNLVEIFTQNADYIAAGECVFGSRHKYGRSVYDCPHYLKGNVNTTDDNGNVVGAIPWGWNGAQSGLWNFSDSDKTAQSYFKIYTDMEEAGGFDKMIQGCGGCPDPHAGNYTGECIHEISDQVIPTFSEGQIWPPTSYPPTYTACGTIRFTGGFINNAYCQFDNLPDIMIDKPLWEDIFGSLPQNYQPCAIAIHNFEEFIAHSYYLSSMVMFTGYDVNDLPSFNEQNSMSWFNQCVDTESNRDGGYDLTYGRGIPTTHPFYSVQDGGAIYGFALDGDARPLKGSWNGPERYVHHDSECEGGSCNYNNQGEATNALFEPNLDLCYYEQGCADSSAVNDDGLCCNDNTDANGYQCETGFNYGTGQLIFDCNGNNISCGDEVNSYNYCRSPFGCANIDVDDGNPGCCKYDINCACCDQGACNYLNCAGEGSTDGDGWFGDQGNPCYCAGQAGTPCADISEADVCDDPIEVCQDCDGDGLPDTCALDNPDYQEGWNVCPDMNGIYPDEEGFDSGNPGPTVCNNVYPDCINYWPTDVHTPVRCDGTQDLFPNCPTNVTHGTYSEDRPCTHNDFVDQCCIPPGSDLDDGTCTENPGGYIVVNPSIYDDGNGGSRLYCCRQQDDCGNCEAIGDGWILQDGGYPYTQGNGIYNCNDQDNQHYVECQCLSQTYANIDYFIRYVNGEPDYDQIACNCEGDTVIDCNCNSNDPEIQNASCGGTQINVCEQCQDSGDAGVDGCNNCPDDPNYGVEPITCDTINPSLTFGQLCDCDGSECGCDGGCGSGGNFVDIYFDGDSDGCCDYSDNPVQWCDLGILENDYPGYHTLEYCQGCTFFDSGWDEASSCGEEGSNGIIDACGDCILCPSGDMNVCMESPSYNARMDCRFENDLFPQDNQSLYCTGGDLTAGGYAIDKCGNCRPEATYNDMLDDCGLCPSIEGDTAPASSPNTIPSINSIGNSITVTWGSFGCQEGDWFANPALGGSTTSNQSSVGTGGLCGQDQNGINHCGCQCAGCINPLSPAHTPHAKWSTTCTQQEIDARQCYDWMCHQPPPLQTSGQIGDPSPTEPGLESPGACGVDYCNDYMAGWQIASDRFEVRDAYRYLACDMETDYSYDCFFDLCYDPTTGNVEGMCSATWNITCADVGFPGSVCLGNEFALQQRDDWYYHGKMEFFYCANDTLGHNSYEHYNTVTGQYETVNCGTDFSATDMQECLDRYGPTCCGTISGKEHCRTGVRSDLYWSVERATTLEDNMFDQYFGEALYGDINQDGVVNVQDLVAMVNYVIGTADLNLVQQAIADINSDGLVDVLDIVATVNIILEIDFANSGGTSGNSRMLPYQESQLIKSLLPMFGGNVNIRRRVQFQNPIMSSRNYISKINRLNHNNQLYNSSRDDDNGGGGGSRNTTYPISKFDLLFNAPECMFADNLDFEIGYHFEFEGGYWQAYQQGEYVGIRMTQEGQFKLVNTSDINYHLLTIYHPNVHLQSGGLGFGPLQGTNAISLDITNAVAANCYDDPENENSMCGQPECDFDYDGDGWTDDSVCLGIYEWTHGIFGFNFDVFEEEVHCPGACEGVGCTEMQNALTCETCGGTWYGSDCVDRTFMWFGAEGQQCTIPSTPQ